MKPFSRIFIPILTGLVILSCEKNDPITDPDAKLAFSTDTVLFDTIFTTVGSTTRNFRVYNTRALPVVIDRIALAQSPGSPFRLNINGRAVNELEDVEIPGYDSIFIFVAVTLDPNGLNNPMVVQDSVVFETNGNTQDVDLVAFGQDVHLINGEILETQRWINDKPYLVYNSMVVDSLNTLTIGPGTRIHFHKRSSMLVKGTLKVTGTLEDPVWFQGDRLEHMYDSIPGQWGAWIEYENGSTYILGGIHFLNGSLDNEIRHAVIKNGMKGIQIDTIASVSKPALTLSDTRIENMSVAGIYAQSSTILASNCVIADCGLWCVALTLGGSYEFYHCTISNHWGAARTEPAVILNNYYVYEGTAYVYPLNNALFANCIITGNRQMEIGYENTINNQPVPGTFNYFFDHCLVRVDTLSTDDPEHWKALVKNVDPRFISQVHWDYRLDSLSPAQDKADMHYSSYFPRDMLGNSRFSDKGPDIGAFERVEK